MASPVDRPGRPLVQRKRPLQATVDRPGRPKQTESKDLQSGSSRSTVTVDRETCTLIRAFARTSVDPGGRPVQPVTGTVDRGGRPAQVKNQIFKGILRR